MQERMRSWYIVVTVHLTYNPRLSCLTVLRESPPPLSKTLHPRSDSKHVFFLDHTLALSYSEHISQGSPEELNQ